MEYHKFGNQMVVRLDRGEEVIEKLSELCGKEKVKLAAVSGIGAADYVKIGLYNYDTQRFSSREYAEPMEITSLLGTVTEMEGKPYLHLHINVANEENLCRGGHLSAACISCTGELVLTLMDGEIGRKKDWFSGTGLNLLCYDS